jgi:alpha/beta superfamily hydrolase
MPEVIFTGPGGRIEGRYHPARQKNAPIGIVLHPHPQFGGTMNHQIVYQIYYAFVHRRRSTGRNRSIRKRAAAGSPASRSAPGSACSF